MINCPEIFLPNDWPKEKKTKLKIHIYMFIGYLNLNTFPGLMPLLNRTYNQALSKTVERFFSFSFKNSKSKHHI